VQRLDFAEKALMGKTPLELSISLPNSNLSQIAIDSSKSSLASNFSDTKFGKNSLYWENIKADLGDNKKYVEVKSYLNIRNTNVINSAEKNRKQYLDIEPSKFDRSKGLIKFLEENKKVKDEEAIALAYDKAVSHLPKQGNAVWATSWSGQTEETNAEALADLLVWLSRSMKVPARKIQGVVLNSQKEYIHHVWVEVVDADKNWMVLDPFLGGASFEKMDLSNYIYLGLSDGDQKVIDLFETKNYKTKLSYSTKLEAM